MHNKLTQNRRTLIFFMFALLFLFQYLVLGRFTTVRIIQFSLLNIMVFTFIFAFRAYELDTLKSYNAALISYAVGSFIGTLIGMFFIILIFGTDRDIYRHEFILTTLYCAAVYPLLSIAYYKIIHRRMPPSRYLVIGDRKRYEPLIEEIRTASHNKISAVRYITTREELLEARESTVYDALLIAQLETYKQLRREVADCEKQGIEKQFITEVAEYWLYRIPLTIFEEYQEYYDLALNHAPIPHSKRILDVIFSIIMGVLTAPFILLFGFLVLITSGLPVIFKQERVGLYERPFTFYKIRSLRTDRDYDKNDDPNATIDRRITFIGHIIRKTRIDEFPQFVNILRGSMSVVGPRPEMVNYHEKWIEQIPHYGYRNMVRPGLTGWAQIHFSHTSTLEEYITKTELDLYYVKNKSTLFDIRIILMTFETVIGMRGSR
jgi:lipopolysaccharide/colanic/teichoic acid biosynthesis glycosyltransferase